MCLAAITGDSDLAAFWLPLKFMCLSIASAYAPSMCDPCKPRLLKINVKSEQWQWVCGGLLGDC